MMNNESHIPHAILTECQRRLLQAKADLLTQIRSTRHDFANREFGGDEIDQSVAVMQETQLMSAQNRQRVQLFEIESALARMQSGDYGFCEETDEPIEVERLLAIPWTRLSLEGAERREDQARRRAVFAPGF